MPIPGVEAQVIEDRHRYPLFLAFLKINGD